MEFKIEIPKYENGFIFRWENEYRLGVEIVNNQVRIDANKEGLISLARHLINLSQDDFKAGDHFHLDDYTSSESGSNELIIQKI